LTIEKNQIVYSNQGATQERGEKMSTQEKCLMLNGKQGKLRYPIWICEVSTWKL